MRRNSSRQHETRPKDRGNRTLRLELLEQRLALSNFLGLADAGLATYVRSLTLDGAIDRTDMIGILRKVQSEKDGVVDKTDLGDLRKIVQYSAALNMPNHVSVLAGDVLNGSPANARYQGTALGNLAAGNSNAKLGKLVDKWFYGGDLPSTGGYAYATASGSLYASGGPSHFDEKQGQLGDCYLIAALGSIADSSQAAIKNMFIANSDGTWTVRFYYNGKADYVTVNRKLPVSGRTFIFDGYGSSYSNANNALWLPLLEKAYVQWNETGRTWQGNASNNYSAIEGGWMGDVYQQALGYSTIYFAGTSASNAQATMIDALRSRQAVTLGTTTGSHGSTGLYGNHAYNVLSYNGASGKFTLYNPWGCCQPKQLTWSQLRANADFFSATTTKSTPATSAIAGHFARPISTMRDAALTTTASTLDSPTAESQTDALPASAVDAAIIDWDVSPGDTSRWDAAAPPASKSWMLDVSANSVTRLSGTVYADVDTLFDSIRSQVTVAL